MKKKGFTLVELLAVIAILAILVIVAMPNVLGMFNQAKANTFVTEVQKYMDTAKTSFMTEAMSAGGKEVVFASNKYKTSDTKPAGSKELAMDGSAKNYVIWFNRNGEFERVIIYDANFCYDSLNHGRTTDTNGKLAGAKLAATPDGFDKSSVKVSNVVEVATGDTINISSAAATGGCAGTIVAKTE